jgi:DNA-binding MarR family transcriptional regulator
MHVDPCTVQGGDGGTGGDAGGGRDGGETRVADTVVPARRVLARESHRDERLAAWAAFLRAHAAVKAKLERELLVERDLPLTWYEVLLHLNAFGHELRMQELARSVLLSKSGLTRLVDRMEAAGLVARRACESDRRGLMVGITPAGDAALRRAAPVHLRGVTEHFTSHLSIEELRVLQTVMERVAEAAEDGAAPPPQECGEDVAGEDG